MARKGFLGKIEDELRGKGGNKKDGSGIKEAFNHLKEFIMSPTGIVTVIILGLIIHHYTKPKKAAA